MSAVKRSLIGLVLITVAGVGGAWAYHAASRDRDYRVMLGRGDAALRDEQTFAAIEAYSGAIALRPDSMLAHLRRGETYQRRGDLEAAARDYQTAAILDAMATRPLEELADIRYAQQRFHRAGEIYEQALRLDDRAARVSYKLALARYRDGRADAALTALETALRLDDQMTDAYYLQSLCFRDQRRPAEAQRALEKAVSLSPGLIAAREELADLYGSLGRRGDQLAQLHVLAGLDRNRVERQIAIGLAHARWAGDSRENDPKRAGQANLAVLTLGTALERTPDQPQIYAALGRIWLEIAQDRTDAVAMNKALEALERAASSSAATSEALTLYGRALLQSGRTDLAERTLQQATERFPVDPAAFRHLADAAEQQNHLDSARRALLQYDALVGDDDELALRAARIAALSLKVNDRTTAAVWVARGLDKNPEDESLLALRRRLP
ncbi:MAG: tetratricopeptide repeat protein [Acidobacteriota bacterium]